MFRIAAIAFVWAATFDVASSFIGLPHVNYAGVLIVGLLCYVGAAVTWLIPWHRLPVDRFVIAIVFPGVALLWPLLMFTGGVHSHVLPMFISPAVFMAAAYGLRAGLITAGMTLVGAAIPLLVQGMDAAYLRELVVVIATMLLATYIPSRVRKSLVAEYERREQQQEESYISTIAALAAALDAKDRYTESHSRETASLALAVGRRLGLDPATLRSLEYGALLHDIGKIGIPGYILHKPGPLTPEEFAVMKEHPVMGERILASVPFLAPVSRIVRAEHERWDGTGYPDGLRGEEIPVESRVIHACDAFHAMATDRAYRRALPASKILAEFQRERGKQFDPRVVDVLLDVLEKEKPALHAEPQEAGRPQPAVATSGPRSWAQQLETIEELGQQLAHVTSIEDICGRIGETIASLVPHDHCRILLQNQARGRLEAAFLAGGDRPEYSGLTAEDVTVRIGEGITGWVAETRRGVVLSDAERHPKAAHIEGTEVIDESMLAVPVVFQDQLLGVIAVLKLGLNQYSLDQLRLLTILANQAAVSIANARLIDRLAASALLDPLTGLNNRPAFEEELRKALATAPASGLALLLVDVERTREVNESYGYPAGDAVLKRVADALRQAARPQDVVARWVSDDFVVLLPGAGMAVAHAMVRRLKPALLADRISLRWAVACYPEDGQLAAELVARAALGLAPIDESAA